MQIQIHKDKAEIEKERAAIKRDKKVWEADKQIELENLQEEFDNEHGEKLKEQQDTIKRLTRKISKYIQDNKDMQEELDNIHATFEETDAQNMVKEYNALKARYKGSVAKVRGCLRGRANQNILPSGIRRKE